MGKDLARGTAERLDQVACWLNGEQGHTALAQGPRQHLETHPIGHETLWIQLPSYPTQLQAQRSQDHGIVHGIIYAGERMENLVIYLDGAV